jgi:lipoprotein-releasing system permease protein
MTLGVASLILVLSVMNGFREELSGRFLRILPHATIYPGSDELSASLAANALVLEQSPVVEEVAMASTTLGKSMVSLTGIDPDAELDVVDIESSLIDGNWAQFSQIRFGVLLGAQTARTLQVRIGDSVRIELPAYQITPLGIYLRTRNFDVMGIYSSSSQLDGDVAFIRLQDAEILFRNVAARRGIRVKTADPDNLPALSASLASEGVEFVSWQQRLNGLYEAMRLEKMVVGVMLLAVIFVAAFSLVASLMMSVAEKRTDIAVMRTMGAESKTILGVFLLQGLLFGGVGVLFGALLGSLLALFLSDISAFFESLLGASLFDPTVFYISFLPSQWRVTDLIVVVFCAMFIALLASLLPAWHASRIAPAEAIHYNH